MSNSEHPSATQPERPWAGLGAADLQTESTDPGELQALLERARERLTFYEGFDRLIGENLRRSEELMLETISIREQVAAGSARAERDRLAASLDDVALSVSEVRAQLEALLSRVATLQDDLRGEAANTTANPIAEPPAQPETETPARNVEDGWPTPQGIAVIAHQVPRAASALALQQYLGELSAVAGVEAREFAEGVLRLQVVAHRPLLAGDFAAWAGIEPLTVLQCEPHAVELAMGLEASSPTAGIHQ